MCPNLTQVTQVNTINKINSTKPNARDFNPIDQPHQYCLTELNPKEPSQPNPTQLTERY